MPESRAQQATRGGMFRAQAVGELLDEVLGDLGIQEKLREYQAVLAWEQAAGPALAQHARALRMHRGRLVLAVASGVWRTQLSFSKQELIERVNEQLGRRVVRDLVFVNRRTEDGWAAGMRNTMTPSAPKAQERGS